MTVEIGGAGGADCRGGSGGDGAVPGRSPDGTRGGQVNWRAWDGRIPGLLLTVCFCAWAVGGAVRGGSGWAKGGRGSRRCARGRGGARTRRRGRRCGGGRGGAGVPTRRDSPGPTPGRAWVSGRFERRRRGPSRWFSITLSRNIYNCYSRCKAFLRARDGAAVQPA